MQQAPQDRQGLSLLSLMVLAYEGMMVARRRLDEKPFACHQGKVGRTPQGSSNGRVRPEADLPKAEQNDLRNEFRTCFVVARLCVLIGA